MKSWVVGANVSPAEALTHPVHTLRPRIHYERASGGTGGYRWECWHRRQCWHWHVSRVRGVLHGSADRLSPPHRRRQLCESACSSLGPDTGITLGDPLECRNHMLGQAEFQDVQGQAPYCRHAAPDGGRNCTDTVGDTECERRCEDVIGGCHARGHILLAISDFDPAGNCPNAAADGGAFCVNRGLRARAPMKNGRSEERPSLGR